MKDISNSIALVDVLRACYERGWISTRDGNASFKARLTNEIYITPSGVVKSRIHPDEIVKIDLNKQDDYLLEKASGEFKMHELLQKDIVTEDRAVLHAHPTHIIAAMYAGWDLQLLAEQFPEIHRYTRVGATVPTVPPLTNELATLTYENIKGFHIVGQSRHGATSIGKSIWEAFEHMERLEHICEIALKSGVSPL